MTHTVIEHRFTCPYCWESITMLLDLTAADQAYVEDCEVCCHPINLRFRAEYGAIVVFDAQQLP
jgi:transcription elongation factor Elf1